MDLTFDDVVAILTRLTFIGVVLTAAALTLILRTWRHGSFGTTRKIAIWVGLLVALYVSRRLLEIPLYATWWIGLWWWLTELLTYPAIFVLVVYVPGGLAWVVGALLRAVLFAVAKLSPLLRR